MKKQKSSRLSVCCKGFKAQVGWTIFRYSFEKTLQNEQALISNYKKIGYQRNSVLIKRDKKF
jgi:hypothetical protein